MKGKRMKKARGKLITKDPYTNVKYTTFCSRLLVKFKFCYHISARCTHEDRVQFNKAVIDLVVADYKTINGNGRANFCKNLQMEECPKILTIADKQKAKFNWKFDEMDKNR